MTRRSLCVLAGGSLLAASMAFAQQSGSTSGQRRPIPQPSNLKVLPKDTSGEQVITIMQNFEGQLGVGCGYCHAKASAAGQRDFASDANPMKDRARVMMKMTSAINAEYLTQLTDPKPENPVTCGTCHRGMAQPSVFVPAPHKREGGAPATAPATPPPSN